jgi:hypothetical protein
MKHPPLKITATGDVGHATKVYKIRKAVLISPVAVSEVVITDAADVEWIRLKAVTSDSKVIDFSDAPLELTGLTVTTLTSSAVLLLYLG